MKKTSAYDAITMRGLAEGYRLFLLAPFDISFALEFRYHESCGRL